jgi:flagellar FliL protein
MADAPKDAAAPKDAPKSGGIANLVPLIVMLVGMPAMAFVMTNFVLLPKLKAELGSSSHPPAAADAEAGDGHGETKKDDGHGAKKDDGHGAKKDDGHGAKKDDGHGKSSGGHGAKESKSSGGARQTFQLNKVLVNVAGSAGSRYLIANYTLVGSSSDFKAKLEDRKDQLLDVAIGVMGSKSITDLEKPGARNLIRNELMAAWNTALSGNVVKEIYITEFAIQ